MRFTLAIKNRLRWGRGGSTSGRRQETSEGAFVAAEMRAYGGLDKAGHRAGREK